MTVIEVMVWLNKNVELVKIVNILELFDELKHLCTVYRLIALKGTVQQDF
jgi:hypothetical protein